MRAAHSKIPLQFFHSSRFSLSRPIKNTCSTRLQLPRKQIFRVRLSLSRSENRYAKGEFLFVPLLFASRTDITRSHSYMQNCSCCSLSGALENQYSFWPLSEWLTNIQRGTRLRLLRGHDAVVYLRSGRPIFFRGCNEKFRSCCSGHST